MTVLALDFGTTRIKGGRFDSDGRLHSVVSRDAPSLSGDAEIRESSPDSYLDAATTVLEELTTDPPRADEHVSLGIASQRSTFTIWDTHTSEAVAPLISWQDRRASDWCARHAADEPTVQRLTGLPLSPHYAGPKLAALFERRPDLHEGLAGGTLKFGTLESWVLWRWSGGQVHETDLTMAARTQLADPRSSRWHPTLLALFGVPSGGLPSMEASCDRMTAIDRRITVTASVGDQAAGALAALRDRTDAVLVNLGTGGFVLRPTGTTMTMIPDYLSGPLLSTPHELLFAVEGTINGAGRAVDRFASAPTHLPSSDPAPDAFALPDDAGVGSPYWRADLSLTLSRAAEGLDAVGKRRIVAEGLVFRVREIVDGLTLQSPPRIVRLSGGLSRDPFFAPALAACLNRPVEMSDDGEQTLRGAGWLAAGRPATPIVPTRLRRIDPATEHDWLRDKYPRWKRWLERVLSRG
jgi:glycerol kinase